MGRTKDESFLLKLYEEALLKSEIEDPLDPYKVGELVGLHKVAVETICKLLIRSNFIKKHGQSEIRITPHGVKLAQQLRNEKF